MKAEVHYVAGYLKQAGEAQPGAAAADTGTSVETEREKKNPHHNSGVAHRILQVGFIVPQVGGTGF